MKILVVGAGAVGGYFGGRLAQAGQDVTFLVRPGRAAQLQKAGLVIKSPLGDATLHDVKTVLAEQLQQQFDLIILSCKAYDLASAIASFAPAVGPQTLIMPLLNGMQHMDVLQQQFGAAHVLGGQCLIAATLDREQQIVHLNNLAAISFGTPLGGIPDSVQAVVEAMRGAQFEASASDDILQLMWEKWVFLATLAGSTCLFRASIGDILSAPDGAALITALWEECQAIAAHNGHPPRPAVLERTRQMLFAEGSPLTASMLRDVENQARTEVDPILGDLLARAPESDKPTSSVLNIAFNHLKAYEARRVRAAA
jgi:2-dehydropantoate 2-reductase